MVNTKTRERTRLVLAAVFIAHAIATTPFWSELRRGFTDDGMSYAEKRVAYAFAGLPIDRIRANLAAMLPETTPVALSDELLRNDFRRQRLTEGLYPRQIEKSARAMLDIVAISSLSNASGAQTLARFGPEHVLVLKAPGESAAQAETAATPESFDFSLIRFIGCLLSALGFGLATTAVVGFLGRRTFELSWLLAFSTLASGIVIGAIGSLGTWLNLPVITSALAWIGIALVPAALYVLKPKFARPKLEILVLIAFLTLMVVRLVNFPITLWDGRSIWYFHARRIFTHGMLARPDLLHVDSNWSHTAYPLMVPTWLAFFSTWSDGFNERMASLGSAILFGSILALLWPATRKLIGRWPGAAYTLCVFFSVVRLTAGGYVDGYVTALLALEFAAFAAEDLLVGWTAAMAASLCKQEGLVFAALIALAFHLRKSSTRARLGFLCFLPALFHEAWAKSLGLQSDFHGIRWAEVFGDLGWRANVVLDGIGKMLWRFPLTVEGLLGLLAVGGAWVALRARARAAAQAIGLGLSMLAIVFALFLITPIDIHWHVNAALDRLLLYPAALFALAPFLLLGRERPPPLGP